MAEPLCVRSILPNTTGAYLLRVDPFSVTEISIIGWRIEWTRRRVTDTRSRIVGQDVESSNPWPITPEDDYDGISNAIEFIVDRGMYVVPLTCAFESRDEAVGYARAELAKHEAK